MGGGKGTDGFTAATAPLTFHDFLERMRHPAAADLVRSIKSFILDFMAREPNAERDASSVQDFLTSTEDAFRAHPLWQGATEDELESAGEGLEKYLMTKIFTRAFAPSAEEVERDRQLSAKIAALQQFVRPEQLDIPTHLNAEASWLLAEKELQKMGSFKAPRDKLVCVLNCCRVVNNLLLNAALGATGEATPPGADDFLPVLIYVLMKANPPQLLSNVEYIQRYRHPRRLVSEAAYFFTNLVSATSFIENISAASLTMPEAEFNAKMQVANQGLASRIEPFSAAPAASSPESEASVSQQPKESTKTGTDPKANLVQDLLPKLESELAQTYPFLHSRAEDLRVGDVELLLQGYKELVLGYTALCRKAVAEGKRREQGQGQGSGAADSPPVQEGSDFLTSMSLNQVESSPAQTGAASQGRSTEEKAGESGGKGKEDETLEHGHMQAQLFEGLTVEGLQEAPVQMEPPPEDLLSHGSKAEAATTGTGTTEDAAGANSIDSIPDDLRELEEALARSRAPS